MGDDEDEVAGGGVADQRPEGALSAHRPMADPDPLWTMSVVRTALVRLCHPGSAEALSGTMGRRNLILPEAASAAIRESGQDPAWRNPSPGQSRRDFREVWFCGSAPSRIAAFAASGMTRGPAFGECGLNLA